MNPELKPAVMSALRSILIAFGGYAAGKGWLSPQDVEPLTGLALVVLTAAWGIVEKLPKKEPK